MEKNNNEERGREKMSVATMSKKVFKALIIMQIILFVFDFVKSSQNGDISWIVKYMQRHYPGLFVSASSSTSAADASSYDQYEYETESKGEDDSYLFSSEGFLFPDSDSEYLNEDELYALQAVEGYDFKELLGYARNEIYARHGFPFNVDGKYYKHYSQYSWYNEMEHNDVSGSDLNQYETENIRLIVSVEEAEGFR